MVSQGDLLAGKYRVENVLGEGGMGYVVAARHEELNQRVAVKLLAPELCRIQDSVTRFLREARAAVRVRSEHVARVLDVGKLADGSPYMVMEFLHGRDLAGELDEHERFEVEQAIDFVLQASEAVAEAHSLGLIHRDLKPSNLFLTARPDGTPLVKVLDFGISKAIVPEAGEHELPPSLTATHSLLGSPSYMSPEQVRRPKTVDQRTDIWSLGSILYEFLVGEGPFGGESTLAVLAAVVSDPLPSVREKRPDVAPGLEAAIAKCLEKRPEDRYQTVAEFAEALAPFARASSLSSISRITGILRSSLPPVSRPAPSSSRTLKSNESLPNADTEAVRVHVVPSPPVEGHALTQTHWAASQAIVNRSRRRWMVGLTAVTVAALVGLYLLRARDAATRVATADRQPPGSAAPPESPQATSRLDALPLPATASHPSAAPVPSAALSLPETAPTASINSGLPARAAAANKAKPPRPPAERPPAPSASPPPAPSAAPRPPPLDDPLEGRH